MTPLSVSGQLRLVQGNKRSAPAISRHRLDRAAHIASTRRLYPFLAGDQSDFAGRLDRANPVVNFARKQAQGKAHAPA